MGTFQVGGWRGGGGGGCVDEAGGPHEALCRVTGGVIIDAS
jgi:hypothetical protein